jgi:voltage-gated potassium channel
MVKPQRILFTRSDTLPGKALLIRIGIVIFLLSLVVMVLWFDREGLRDQADGHITFWDVVYFAMVTITTVGYGDIVPVTERARLLDAFYITPIRIFIWFIFLGTAYQFVFQKFLEEYRMAKLERRLDRHMIICGYGHTGRVAAQELVKQGKSPEQMVVIDISSQPVQEAADAGFVALKGDAAKESLLQKAGLDKASAVLISPGRDDTNVLIVLTVRQLNRSVKIISSVKEEENLKLLKQAGADVIVSPSTVGGYMMADAVDRHHTVEYVYDLMTAGGRISLTERMVLPEEVGHAGSRLKDGIIVRVYRGQDTIGFWELDQKPLQAGDLLLLIIRAEPAGV